jgi:hypothetical protein
MGDQLLSLAGPCRGLVPKPPDEGHRIRSVPTTPGGEAPQPIGRPTRSLSQHDAVLGDLDIEAVTGLDPEIVARLARNDDLMLGADLHA